MADKTVIVSDNSLSVTENQSVDITASLNTVSAPVNTDSKSLTYEDNIFYVTPYDNKFVSGTSTPVWVQNLVDLSVNTGLSTVDAKIDALRLYVDQQDTGITQEIVSTNTNVDSLNALVTTIKSQVDTNTASIGNIQLTYATKDYVGTEVITLMESKWNTYADSFIATVDATYADNFQAWSNRVTTLESSYTDLVTNTNITSTAQDQFFTKAGIDSTTGELTASSGYLREIEILSKAASVKVDTAEGAALGFTLWDGISAPVLGNYKIIGDIKYVYVGGTAGVNNDGWVELTPDTDPAIENWITSANKLSIGLDGEIVGWEFYNTSGTPSLFKISADTFQIANGTTGIIPFTVDTVNNTLSFNGIVNFSNVSNVPNYALTDMSNVTTIDGGKITTGSLRANQLYTNRLVNIGAYNTDGTINESAVTMDINFGSGYIYIK